jgi:hypothetical protein
MNTNPYAPPTAVVADVVPGQGPQVEPPFFAVSPLKLAIMCVCTLNFYQVYWFYRHWQHIEAREPEGRSPLGRGVFAIFYCYQCFTRIRDYASPSALRLHVEDGELEESLIDPDQRLAAGPLALGWIAVTLFSRLTLSLVPGVSGGLSWLWVSTVLFLIPVQRYANQLNAMANPSHNRNARLTVWNWLVVGPMALVFLSALAGALSPASGL